MKPDIFLDDFERSENSDALQAMVGRALIIATRFDAMCTAAARGLELKITLPLAQDERQRANLIKFIATRYRTLHKSIELIEFPSDISEVLGKARSARNVVAHELGKDLTGCLDMKTDESLLISQVAKLMGDLADGDAVISLTLSAFNHDPIPRPEFLSSYKERVVRWVVEK